jgi:hypothetical protein
MISNGLDKAQWIQQIRRVHSDWDSVLQGVSRDWMLVPGVEGSWALKDVIAHVTFWEERAAINLEAALEGHPPERSPYAGLDTDAYNEAIYRAKKDRSLDEILRWSQAVHDRVIAAVQKLSEEDLTDKSRFPWLNNPLWEHVEGNGYEHITEHAQDVRAWLQRVTGVR